MCGEREACNEYVKGEGRGWWVRLTAVVTMQGVFASCMPHTGGVNGSRLAVTHREPGGHSALVSSETLGCVLQLQLGAGARPLVVHPHKSYTLLV